MATNYDANSIQVKSFREAARSTPGMYLGADGQDAAFNCFLEILNNACDEAIMGRGNKIIVEYGEEDISVEDFGAGVPRGRNKDCEEVLIEIFTAAHSSGKFNTDNYKKVRGVHGVGSSAVCVCSKVFEVTTKRDGYAWGMTFLDGVPQSNTASQLYQTKDTGTKVEFQPDRSIFHITEGPTFDYERIRNELELTSYFIPGVQFILKNGNKVESFLSKNGLRDFAASRIKNPLHKNYIYGYETFADDVEVEVFAQWTGGKEKCYVFSNGALNSEGGTPVTGAKTAFTRTVNSLAKTDFNSDSIREGLVYIINVRHPHPIYQNQVKNKIQNPELRGYTQTAFTNAIKDFTAKNKTDFDTIVGMLKKIEKAEAAAEKARQQVLDATKDIEKNQRRKVFSSDKLKDAEFLGQDSVLCIVEGNSALGGMALARDPKKFGLLGVRGKMLNALAHTEDRIYANEEIKLLLSAMNITPGKYDSSKLRYGKLAICTDADADGYHIGLLIMSVMYYLAPEFLREGRLYWLRSPLYIVKNGKKESYYFTDEEFNKVRDTIKGEVQRNKGLGSLEDEQAHNSMFTPEYQRLEQITFTPESEELLVNLMQADNSYRSEFVFSKIDFSEIRE